MIPYQLSGILPNYITSMGVYLMSLNSSQFIVITLIGFTVIVAIWVYLKYFSYKMRIAENSVMLEIKPPATSLQSAFSTQQLFTIIHSLDHAPSFYEQLLGVKPRTSYEIVSTREEGIKYILFLPASDVEIVSKNIRAYLPEVTICETKDYLQSSFDTFKLKKYTITEFRLKNAYPLPLSGQDKLTHHDPIAYITAHMTKLTSEEHVSLQLITTPVTRSFHPAILKHVDHLNERIQERKEIRSILGGSSSLLMETLRGLGKVTYTIVTELGNIMMDWVMTPKKTTQPATAPELTPHDLKLQQAVERKINQGLFEVTMRLMIVGTSRQSVVQKEKGIIASLATFANPGLQSLILKPRFPLRHALVDKYSYFKLKYRLHSLFSNPILSIAELSSLYHFPYTDTTQTEDLQLMRSTALPAPLELKKTHINLDIVFARNLHGQSETPIGLTLEERRRHMYIIGATGMGKSTLMLHMLSQDMKNGRGFALLDPHGDLSKHVAGIIPSDRIHDVVYFNPYDNEFPIGLNMLEIPIGLSPTDLEREKDLIVSSIVSIFHKLYGDKYMGPRMEHVMRNTILTALELENPTFVTVYKLLTNAKFRTEAKKQIKNEIILTFWKEEFERLTTSQKAETISPITNKLGRFLTTPMIRNIVSQSKSTFTFDDVMNSRKILICNLSMGEIGEDVSAFLGSLIVAKIQLAALRRVHIPQSQRVDFFLYIDEFQNFATMSFAQILSEARKYRLGAILAHQNVKQIEDSALLDTIIANSGTILAFRTKSPTDETTLLPIFAPQVQKGNLGNLPSYNFYIKINALEPQNAFTGMVDIFDTSISKSTFESVIDFSRTTYGVQIKAEPVSEPSKDMKEPAKVVKKRPTI